MPVDPIISLGVTGGSNGLASPGAAVAASPLALAGAVADIQNKLNTNKAFQLSLAAKQKLGQIMASSPDIPTAIQRAQQDSAVAPFVPEIVNTIAQTQNAVQTNRGQIQSQTGDAFTRAAGLIPGEFVDPGSIERNLPSVLKTIPDPGIRQTVSDSMDNIVKGLTTDLPADPDARKAELMKRITAAGLQTGSLDAMSKLWAQPSLVDKGDVKQPITTQGPIPTMAGRAPGTVQNAGNALQLGLPPQITQTGGVLQGGKYGAGGGTAAPAPDSTFVPLESLTAGDGKPLVPKGYSGQAPVISRGTGTGGSNVLSPEQQTRSQQLSKDFSTSGQDQYNAAVNTIGSLDEMDRNVDNMAAKGGLLTPGSFGETRLAFGKAANTISQAFGGSPVFDPSAVASGEDVIKNTQRMGISTLQTMLGSQREAAETIKNMTEKGIPGLDNSVMGFKVVNASIKAAAQRQIELRNFENAWANSPKNQGNLTNAVEAFNAEHPASGYINKALDVLGMDKSGFKSPQAVIDAMGKGYLTREQATKILKDQFPKGE